MKKLVAVTGDSAAREFGRLVGWDLRGSTHHSTLWAASDALGIPEDMRCPPADSTRALRLALKKVMPEAKYRHEFIKRPLGVSLKSRRQTADEEQGADVELETQLRIFIQADNTLKFQPSEHPLRPFVEDEYALQLATINGTAYSTWLIGQMRMMFVTQVLRGRGGCYFIPADCLEQWDALVDLTHSVTPHVINEIGCFPSDERAVSAVLNGITAELKQRVQSINDALEDHADEVKTLGSRALATLHEEIKGLETKTKFYEGLLGTSLDVFKEHFEELELTVSQAMIAVESDKRNTKQRRTAE